MPINNMQLPPRDLHDAALREAQNIKLKQQAALFDSLFGGYEPSDTATRNISEGDLVMGPDCLYKAIRNIPHGTTLVEGMNVRRTNISEYIASQNKEME